MTQEDKQLLLKDLCARLPYEVIVEVTCINDSTYHKKGVLCSASNEDSNCNGTKFLFAVDGEVCLCDITEIKPYLRPMSSMTEEEQIVFSSKCELTTDVNGEKVWAVKVDGYDWLNAHHFDHRNLIPKGLALAASKDMYQQ